MIKKQEKKIELNSNIDLEGELNKVIKSLQSISNEYPDYHRFELEYDYDYVTLWGYRWETDKELACRLEKAKKQREKYVERKAKQRSIEYAEYERLKKKYGE